MQVKDLVTQSATFLTNSETPRLDAELLICYVLNISKEQLVAHPEMEVSPEQAALIESYVEKRAQGIPVAYITNEKEFCGLPFYVDEYVLIPRPETELLVESALRHISKIVNKSEKSLRIIDVGTGSACIIISLAQQLKEKHPKIFERCSFVGVDVSEKAIEIAIKNAERHNLSNEIVFHQSDLLSDVNKDGNQQDVIIANLPYGAEGEETSLSTNFEPQAAIFAGQDGLSLYKKLLEQMKDLDVTAFFFEFGIDQSSPLKEITSEKYPDFTIKIHKDLAGIDRILAATIKK